MNSELRKWRSEKIAMKFLYNSFNDNEITINKSPISFFDLFVTLKEKSFFIVVKSSTFITSNKFKLTLELYKKNNTLNIPVLLFCINSNTENGYFDVLIKKTYGGIEINKPIKLRKVTTSSLNYKINEILNINRHRLRKWKSSHMQKDKIITPRISFARKKEKKKT